MRILSLDGGGAWAILQVMALQKLYPGKTGHEVLTNFDLAVANSGGSIVLAGLAKNLPLDEIYKLFNDEKNRKAIFKSLSLIPRLLSGTGILPRYSTKGKLVGLKSVLGDFGNSPMKALPASAGWPKGPAGAAVKLMIVAFDYDSQRSKFFRSYDLATGATADDVSLVDAVHASSDAPVVYFDAPVPAGGRRYWDGAMAGLNNPLMAGLVDLVANGTAIGDIIALSLGTGTTQLAPHDSNAPADLRQTSETGVLADVKKAAGAILDDPPDNASFVAHTLINAACGKDVKQAGSVVRLSPLVRPEQRGDGWYRPDGLTAQQFDKVIGLDMDAVKQSEVDLLIALGKAWLDGKITNQPIRMRSTPPIGEIGDARFADGVARWRALCA